MLRTADEVYVLRRGNFHNIFHRALRQSLRYKCVMLCNRILRNKCQQISRALIPMRTVSKIVLSAHSVVSRGNLPARVPPVDRVVKWCFRSTLVAFFFFGFLEALKITSNKKKKKTFKILNSHEANAGLSYVICREYRIETTRYVASNFCKNPFRQFDESSLSAVNRIFSYRFHVDF